MRHSIIQTRSQRKTSDILHTNIQSYTDTIKLSKSSSKQVVINENYRSRGKTINHCPILASEAHVSSKDENKLPLHVNDLWLEDTHIQAYFDSLTKYVNTFRNNILLVGPILTQMLKLSSNKDILTELTSLSFDKIKIALFCINDHVESELEGQSLNLIERGCHWSLLVYSRDDQVFLHYDSISGSNHYQAKELANKINPDFKFLEEETVQQTDGYSCGLHVLVNSKYLIDKLTSNSNMSKLLQNKIKRCKQNKESSQSNGIQNSKSVFKICKNRSQQTDKLKYKEVKDKHLNVTKKEKKDNFVSHVANYVNCDNRYELLSDGQPDSHPILQTHETLPTEPKVVLNKGLKSQCRSTPSRLQSNVMENPSNEVPKLHKVKIVSDSHGRHINSLLTEQLPGSFKITSVIKPNAVMRNVIGNHSNVGDNLTKNDFLIIIGGTNDITNDLFDLKEMLNFVNLTFEENKNTNVILSYIPFRHDKPELNKIIHRINQRFKQLSKRYQHTECLPLHQIDRSCYTQHGLHLNFSGKVKYVNKLRYSILDTIDIWSGRIPVILNGNKVTNYLNEFKSSCDNIDKNSTYKVQSNSSISLKNNNFLGKP